MHRALSALRPALCLLLLALPAGAFAGQVPESAYSRSMSLRPEFLDYTSLVFQHPQRAPLEGSRVFSFSEGPGSFMGVGAIGETHANALFLLMQYRPPYLPGGSDLLQAGWGASWKSIRFGLAARGAYDRDEETQENWYREDSSRERDESTLAKGLEGSAGFGLRSDAADIDLTFDYGSGDRRGDFLDMSSDPYYPGDTLASHLEEETDSYWGISARIALHLGERADLVAVGAYAGPEREFDLLLYQDSLGTYHISSDDEFWKCGLALAFPTDHIDRVLLSAMLQVEDGFAVDYMSYSSARLRWLEERRYSLALSIEHEIRDALLVRAGLESVFSEMDSYREEIRGYPIPENEAGQYQETTDYFFSWGAGYKWRIFELNGAVRADLDLLNLFTALDVRVRL